MNLDDLQSVGKVSVEVLDAHVSSVVPRGLNITAEHLTGIVGEMVLMLRQKFGANTTQLEYGKIKRPRGWFQMLKEEHFPAWVKRVFPVKYEEITTSTKVVHVCPHLPWREYGDRNRCLTFLMEPRQARLYE